MFGLYKRVPQADIKLRQQLLAKHFHSGLSEAGAVRDQQPLDPVAPESSWQGVLDLLST